MLQIQCGEVASLPQISTVQSCDIFSPLKLMHLKKEFVWSTVQSVISWDEDQKRIVTQIKQAIPFALDDARVVSDHASQDIWMQLDEWYKSRFQLVHDDPPKIVRVLQGAKPLQPGKPAPPKEAREQGSRYAQYVFFSCHGSRGCKVCTKAWSWSARAAL